MRRWIKKTLCYDCVAGVHIFKIKNHWYAIYCEFGIPFFERIKV